MECLYIFLFLTIPLCVLPEFNVHTAIGLVFCFCVLNISLTCSTHFFVACRFPDEECDRTEF